MAAITVRSNVGAQEKKFVTASTFSPFICHDVMGPDAAILVFFNVDFQASFFMFCFHPNQEAL